MTMTAIFGRLKICKLSGFLTRLTPRSYGTLMIPAEQGLWKRGESSFNFTQKVRKLSSEVRIRHVKEDELDILTEWASKENWPVCKHGTRAWYSFDPQGFLVAINADNQPLEQTTTYNIVTEWFLATVNHSDDISFGGYYIVRKDLREKGIGKKLFEEAAKHVGGRNVALNAVLDKIQMYEGKNFPTSTFQIDSFVGTPKPTPVPTPVHPGEVAIIPLSTERLMSVVQYDAGIHTTYRERFLSKWLTAGVACTLVAISDGRVVGYGCLYQKQEKSYAIGPLFADDFEIATFLLDTLILKLELGSSLSFDVPRTQTRFAEKLRSYGFHRFFGCQRMYRVCRQELPDIPLDKVFFLTDMHVSLI